VNDKSPNQVDHLGMVAERFDRAGVSRRTIMKIIGAAAASTAVVGGVPRYVMPASAAPRGVAPHIQRVRQSGEEQVFYHFALQDDPNSFDFNLDLYCQGEPEVWASVLTFDENLNAVPDWAETFEPNEDASVWTFHIHPNNTGWSNGDPVTAHDFVYSWGRQLDPANGAAYAFFLFDIKNGEFLNTQTPNPDGVVPTVADLGVRAIDDWTLEVTCEGSRGYFPQVVAYFASVPSHRPSVEEFGSDRWASGDVPLVSNGPFKLVRWEHNVVVEIAKNEGYWNAENVALSRVVEPIIPAANAALAYEAGEGDQRLDWFPVSANELPRYQADPELSTQLKSYVFPGIWMLVTSNNVPPFDNIQVRKAVSRAIDRDRLVALTNDLVSPANCMVPPGVFGFIDDPEIQAIQSYDPQAAIDALVGTEFEGGQGWPSLTLSMRSNEETFNSDLMANDIVSQLKEVLNMDIQIEVIPEANWRPELFKNEMQIVWIRWWYDYPDPNNGYGDMYYSRKASGKRQAWSNDEFDDLVNQAKAEPDPEARLELYTQCERIIQEDVGYSPIVFRKDQYAFKPWVQGVKSNRQGFTVPEGNIYIRMLTDVFIEGRPAE
jgi:ABC-type oligopeptide transport system substrate-binding subunit